MEQLTLKKLIKHLAQVAKNRPDLLDKKIIISDDMEGNGYHGLWYGICDDVNNAEFICDSETTNPNELVILG